MYGELSYAFLSNRHLLNPHFFTLKKHGCDQVVSTDIAEMWSERAALAYFQNIRDGEAWSKSNSALHRSPHMIL